jgi:hypothetical protein
VRVRIAGKRKTLFRLLWRDLSAPPFLMQFELRKKKEGLTLLNQDPK